MSDALKVMGFVIIATGLYFGVYDGLIEPNLPGHHFDSGDKMELILGGSLVYLGLIGFVLSEVSEKIKTQTK
ncbi:MAG: hypothetical protein HY805_01820 [Nitrospirae bacterium]|nr:hypothetical protein [Nitrospirota bacterium]